MDSQRTEYEQDSTALPLAGFGYGSLYYRVAEISLLPHECPECLEQSEYDCRLCEYFVPSSCPLRQRPHFITDLRTIFDLRRQRRAVPRARRSELIRAVASELRAHGRPLHYQVLARMVGDRYSMLRVTPRRVLRIMSSHPAQFERIRGGVYRWAEVDDG